MTKGNIQEILVDTLISDMASTIESSNSKKNANKQQQKTGKIYVCYSKEIDFEGGSDIEKDIVAFRTEPEAKKWTKIKNEAIRDLELFKKESENLTNKMFKHRTGLKHPFEAAPSQNKNNTWDDYRKAQIIFQKFREEADKTISEFAKSREVDLNINEYRYKEIDLIAEIQEERKRND